VSKQLTCEMSTECIRLSTASTRCEARDERGEHAMSDDSQDGKDGSCSHQGTTGKTERPPLIHYIQAYIEAHTHTCWPCPTRKQSATFPSAPSSSATAPPFSPVPDLKMTKATTPERTCIRVSECVCARGRIQYVCVCARGVCGELSQASDCRA
jgi:hypothetical protein